jgi:phosphoglycerate dehydrogenase-like enzyme
MMKVLFVSRRASDMVSRLRTLLPDEVQMIVPKHNTEEELIRLARDVEIIVCVRLASAVARAATQLKLVQKTGAGVDAIPFEVLGPEVYVANTSGANPGPLAEGTVALVLALAKHIVRRHTLFPKTEKDIRRSIELRGKTAGILGLGHIGIEVARLLKAFKMKLIAVKRRPTDQFKTQLDLEFLGGPSDLDHLLRESDFLIITIPLTPETRGLIGERELRLMKPTAYLINVARAGIVQEAPLYRALHEQWIAGAALDVWWPPHWWDGTWIPQGHTPALPFWTLPNVIATPHNIGSSDIRSDARLRIIAENIRRTVEGRPPINQVNKTLQY